MPDLPTYRPDPVFLTLGEGFSDPVHAADFPQTMLRWRGDRAAAEIGLAGLDDTQWIAHFGRFEPLKDNLPHPLALRYHGHQFRVYNPELGDGRGFLFAQMRDGGDRLIDLGTKGSGTTPWSRRGDGRLTLKGAVRELLATEMLEALGVPTSRTFSIIETGEELWRGDEPSPTRSAVLVRMSHGHIRIGSFQRLAYERDAERLAALVRYALTYYYPGMGGQGASTSSARTDGGDSDAVQAVAAQKVSNLPVRPEPVERPPSANTIDDVMAATTLLRCVVERTADLAASYMVAGFVHGVLNSDNINISGESFDYGPWRFTQYWDPGFTAAYFDHASLYAFGRQPEAIHWDVAQLAIALRTLTPAEPLIAELERFGPLYQEAIARRFLWRIGITSAGDEADHALVAAAEKLMIEDKLPIDQFFFNWRGGIQPDDANPTDAAQAFAALVEARRHKGARDHPYWSEPAPQSMLIDEVESLWAAIAERDDWEPLYQKIAQIRRMGEAHGPYPTAKN